MNFSGKLTIPASNFRFASIKMLEKKFMCVCEVFLYCVCLSLSLSLCVGVLVCLGPLFSWYNKNQKQTLLSIFAVPPIRVILGHLSKRSFRSLLENGLGSEQKSFKVCLCLSLFSSLHWAFISPAFTRLKYNFLCINSYNSLTLSTLYQGCLLMDQGQIPAKEVCEFNSEKSRTLLKKKSQKRPKILKNS